MAQRRKERNTVNTNKSLAALITLCETERGTKSKVLRLLNHRRRQKITWAMLSGWLHPEETERTEPRLSIGLDLLKIQDALCGVETPNEKEQPCQHSKPSA